ncbi:flagellar motility protein MotE (MotC chaperone) [Rhizobium sp. BK313]|jgi:flagellar motility protein MotE (MotC chaperone)|uniref:MotE family protein n=1 Tax=Rhizobium sp. BK313 TaxID=2587081 RepID=UPI0010618C20|nr:MotE family protein [Rhizobium sp. BK313]MBB3455690.1 flagellar motility protein MotE (MotC chaperone) [Rhizobium sp. BK313]
MTSIVTARKMLTSWGVVAVPAMAALLLSVCAAAAQEAPKPVVDPAASQDEIKQFCTNIADPARDQRYLLQKQELEKLQADVDQRIATMDQRKAEYEDWLKRRDDFLKTADSGLVDIYKNMKPDAAAASLDQVKITVAAAIIMKLSPRQSSLVLAEMDPQKAAVVTNIIASASDPNTSKSKDPS